MRKHVLRWGGSLLALATVSAVFAQGETLTWEACVRLTEEGSATLTAARERVEATRARYTGHYAAFMPDVSFDAGAGRSRSSVGAAAREDYAYGVNARQNLFSGWGDRATLARASADLVAAREGFRETSAQIRFELRAAFADLLFFQEQVMLARDIAKRREENVRLVALRFEAGRENRGAYLRSRAASSQANFEMAQAERRLVVARRELARVMGRTGRPVGAVSGRLDLPEPGGDRDLEALADHAPAHTAARAELDAARAGVALARSRHFPSLSASAGIGRSGGDWPPGNERWSTGLNLSLPLFSGGRDLSGARAAEADARRAEAALRVVWGRVLVGLEDADAALKNAVGRANVQEEFVEAAEVRSEIARSQYTNGLLSFEDWDFIESELTNAQNAWLASLRDAVIAEAQWDRTIGRALSP